jgi:hypothetical protein
VHVFTDWPEIHKYMMGSTKLYQDVHHSLHSKIENLEYNYDFVSLLLKEYQKHENLFTYNKLQTSEATSILL